MKITAPSLVSYHLLCHDASILIIPIVATLCSQSLWSGAVAALLLVASLATVISEYGYLAARPLLAPFVLSLAPAHKEAEVCQILAN
jgi:hypothetical protein